MCDVLPSLDFIFVIEIHAVVIKQKPLTVNIEKRHIVSLDWAENDMHDNRKRRFNPVWVMRIVKFVTHQELQLENNTVT